MTFQDVQRYVTIAGAAARFGVSKNTFRKWVQLGIMPAGKALTGREFWDIYDLDAAFAEANDAGPKRKTLGDAIG